jgi:hypothetical protein
MAKPGDGGKSEDHPPALARSNIRTKKYVKPFQQKKQNQVHDCFPVPEMGPEKIPLSLESLWLMRRSGGYRRTFSIPQWS